MTRNVIGLSLCEKSQTMGSSVQEQCWVNLKFMMHSNELTNNCQKVGPMLHKDNNGADKGAKVGKFVYGLRTHRKPIEMRRDELFFGFG